ncbi:MAG: hypothetical protein N2C12_12720 [Planctomycetales bacterium]
MSLFPAAGASAVDGFAVAASWNRCYYLAAYSYPLFGAARLVMDQTNYALP